MITANDVTELARAVPPPMTDNPDPTVFYRMVEERPEAEAWFNRLAKFAESLGYSVESSDEVGRSNPSLLPETAGWTSSMRQLIWIRPDMPLTIRMRTLVHELAHVLRPGGEFRSMIEQMMLGKFSTLADEGFAEGVAALVMKGLGVKSTYSEQYLGLYHLNEYPAYLTDQADDITDAAKQLLQVMEPGVN